MVPECAVSRASAAGLFLLLAAGCSRERHTLDRLMIAAEQSAVRPTIARLDRFPYRPAPGPSPVVRQTAVPTLRIRGAATEILHENSTDDRDNAIAQLLTGDKRKAVDSLTALARQNRSDAVLWSDLAAARYELAMVDDDVPMFASSLAAADQALRLDSSSLPALFNRALALAALSLNPAAIRAFESYRKVDGHSEWSVEATQRIAAIQGPTLSEQWMKARPALEQGTNVDAIAKTFPQYSRTFAESDYLSRWADAFTTQDTAAATHWLRIARAIGATRAQRFGDTLLADAVRSIDRAPRPSALARAYLTYRRGRKMYATENARVLDALPLLEQAEREFASAESPMALIAGYYRANALVDAHEIDRARDLLIRVFEHTPERYRALRAQLYWLKSTIAGITGRPHESLNAAQRSAEEFRKIGEDEHAARMENSVATALRRLGRVRESRTLRRRVFASASEEGKSSLWETTLNSAARDEILERQWDVAASLFGVETETTFASPRLNFDAHLWGAVADAKANGGDAPDLRAARDAAMNITDTAMREEVEREIDFVEGASLAASNPPRAIQLLTNVVDYRIRTSSFARLSAAHFERARAHLVAKHSSEAEEDLHASLAADERVGRSIERDDLRDTFFGGIDDIYETLIELLVAENRLGEAVDVAEKFRARGLNEAEARQQVVARSIDAVAAGIPRGTTILHYTTLQAATLVSIIRSGEHRESTIPASADDLTKLTNALLNAIEHDDLAKQREIARSLYDVLIAPIRRDLRESMLVIVPDETIAAIPFAMLLAPNGRYFVEDNLLVHAASASMFLRHVNEKATVGDRRARFAVITDPAFDAGLFPNLERLAEARRDATWLMPGRSAELLAGHDATPLRVQELLEKSTTAHLATHTIADRNDAWNSLLVLAPEPHSDGALYLHQIANRDLRNLRLVTLAGCRTGTMGEGRGSVRSLSRAFLAAGAHNVIATLWNVDDAATSKASQEFFRARDRGVSPAAALRQAQLALLRSGNPTLASPKTWASLQMQGCNR
jgi:CHAT domain-containing protein